MSTRKFKLKKVISDDERVTFHKGHHVRKATIPEGKRHAIHKETHTRKKPVSAGLIVGIVMSIILLASLTGIYLYVKEKQREARVEAYALRSNREKAAELYAAIPPMVDEATDANSDVADLIEQVKDAVQVVTGAPLPPLPATPKDTKPSGTAETGETAEPTPSPAPDAAPVEQDDGRDAPVGIRPRNELERIRSGAPPEQPSEKEPSTPGTTARPTPRAVGSSRLPARTYPPIVLLAHSILEKHEELTATIDQLEALQEEAEMERDDAYRDRFSIHAQKRVARITEIQKDVESLRDKAMTCMGEIRGETGKLIAMKLRTLEDREKAAEAERQRQLKEQHEALVAKEKEMVAALHENAKSFVKKYEFEEQVNILSGRLRMLKTDEGKTDLKIVIDRLQRMANLKSFVIEGLTASPFQWGWGTGAKAKDVRGADDMVVKVVGGDVPWPDVSVPQFMKFVDHYLASPRTKMSIRADHTLAVAIFYDDLGMDDKAAKNAKEASNMATHLRGEVKRLLPEY